MFLMAVIVIQFCSFFILLLIGLLQVNLSQIVTIFERF